MGRENPRFPEVEYAIEERTEIRTLQVKEEIQEI
jgi:hypothetical protein